MHDPIAVVLALGLPWLTGSLCVAALWRGRVERRGALCLGYGYLVGAMLTTLLLRAASLVDWRWSLPALVGALVVLACTAGYAAWPLAALRTMRARTAAAIEAMPVASRRLFVIFLALSVLNATALACCVAWGLLMPFDALAHWADKSRVWYEYGRIMPFVDGSEWLRVADTQHFWDPNPRHPSAVPLLQVWTALCLGHWDEALVNMPWVAALLALGLAFYGQARRLGAGAAKAMVCTYVLMSVPFLQINVAVAGMADIFVAVTYGAAAASLWQWTRSRQWQDAALALVMAVYCAMVKNEGILWVATLIPAVLVALHRRAGLAICGLMCAAGVAYLAFGPEEVTIMGYSMQTRVFNVATPMLEHMFLMDNWHLFWYAALALVVAHARRLLNARLAPMTATVATAAAFVVVVYFFSTAAGGVYDESLVNRFLLHAVPALAFYLVAVVQDGLDTAADASAAAVQGYPAT